MLVNQRLIGQPVGHRLGPEEYHHDGLLAEQETHLEGLKHIRGHGVNLWLIWAVHALLAMWNKDFMVGDMFQKAY